MVFEILDCGNGNSDALCFVTLNYNSKKIMINQHGSEQERNRIIESMKINDSRLRDEMSFIKAIIVCLGGVIALALLQ